MSPFARPHTLTKPYPISTQELGKNYSWASNNWDNNQVRVGDAVAIHNKDNTVAKLCRVSKVSRHKKKCDKVYSVLCEDGTTKKVRRNFLVHVPVNKEFLRHVKTGEWVKNCETKAGSCLIAKVMVSTPSTTPNEATATPSTTPNEATATPSTTPNEATATANVETPAATPSGTPVNSAGNPDDNSAGNRADNAADPDDNSTGGVGAAVEARPSDPPLPGSAMFKPL